MGLKDKLAAAMNRANQSPMDDGGKKKKKSGGGVVVSPTGTITRATPEKEKTMPGGKRYTVQQLDTTGYSKGKQNFNLVTVPHVGRMDSDPVALKNGKPMKTVTNVPRSKVQETISNLKKGATKYTDLRKKNG